MKPQLESKAEKIAKDPKMATRVARTRDEIKSGNTLDAFSALRDLKEQREKARKARP